MSRQFERIRSLIAPKASEGASPAPTGAPSAPTMGAGVADLAKEAHQKGMDDQQKHEEKLLKRSAKGLKP